VSGFAKLAIAALFWAAVALVQTLNWGEGAGKAAVLFLLLLGGFMLAWRLTRMHPPRAARVPRWLIVLVTVLALGQAAYGVARLQHPRLIDMATTTLAAGQTILAGANPYTQPIDRDAAGLGVAAEFQGYKYLPVMVVAYLPLGEALGERGVLATNLLVLAATLFLIFRLAGIAASRQAGWIAIALYLALPLPAQQVLAKGSTDLVAVLPLLIGMLTVERRAFWAGLCVGLSISAKLFPGVLFIPCLLPARDTGRDRYALGIMVGLLPILSFALASPQALIDNILLFNLLRAPDSTSWLATAPHAAIWAARAGFAAIAISVTAYIAARAPGVAVRCATVATLVLAAILAGPAAHHNYHLWWLPFYAVALAVPLAATSADLQKPRAAL
jgi:hypothetical protein